MAKVYTAHLTKGKKIPSLPNLVFLDITVKSGTVYKEDLAPTWEMLAEYKETKDCERYTEQYFARLEKMSDACKKYLRRLYLEGRDIVLACYCGAGGFCHRHLLSRWLVDNFGFELGGEIDEVKQIPKTSGNYIIVANFNHKELGGEVKALVHGIEGVELVEEVNVQGQGFGICLDFFNEVDKRRGEGLTTVDVSGFCTIESMEPFVRPIKRQNIYKSIVQIDGNDDIEKLKESILNTVTYTDVELTTFPHCENDDAMTTLYEKKCKQSWQIA